MHSHIIVTYNPFNRFEGYLYFYNMVNSTTRLTGIQCHNYIDKRAKNEFCGTIYSFVTLYLDFDLKTIKYSY